MPKTILIMRHAKSSWSDARMTDHDRPLNKRGLKDAPRLGRLLVEQNLVPQRLFHSSAKRTVMTAELLAKQFDGQKTIGGDVFSGASLESMPDLYLAPWTTYVHQMVQLSKDTREAKLDSVMFLGHNPGIEMLIEKLTGRCESVPTATIAWVEMTGDDWSVGKKLVTTQGFKLMDIWRPKEL